MHINNVVASIRHEFQIDDTVGNGNKEKQRRAQSCEGSRGRKKEWRHFQLQETGRSKACYRNHCRTRVNVLVLQQLVQKEMCTQHVFGLK